MWSEASFHGTVWVKNTNHNFSAKRVMPRERCFLCLPNPHVSAHVKTKTDSLMHESMNLCR